MTEKNIINFFQEQSNFVKNSEAFYPPQEIYEILFKMIEELNLYRAIGTVDECREARERQRGKNPVYRSIFTDGTRLLGCPVCFSRIDGGAFYCNGCGQKLDWSDTP